MIVPQAFLNHSGCGFRMEPNPAPTDHLKFVGLGVEAYILRKMANTPHTLDLSCSVGDPA